MPYSTYCIFLSFCTDYAWFILNCSIILHSRVQVYTFVLESFYIPHILDIKVRRPVAELQV